MIAQKTGADIFEIKAATPYPALEKNIDNLAQYDTIFLGYPIWWSAVPRVVMTFLESYDFGGKLIIPFCTHGGSGLAGTEREIKDACPNAEILSGLAIVGKSAQNDSAAVEKDIDAWLKEFGY